jgi:hypothetical protein
MSYRARIVNAWRQSGGVSDFAAGLVDGSGSRISDTGGVHHRAGTSRSPELARSVSAALDGLQLLLEVLRPLA